MNLLSFVHYTLGIKEIDEQHWGLIEIMNNIKSLNYSNTTEVKKFNTVLVDLQAKILHHFEYEELCMERDEYPYTIPHKREHTILTSKLNMLSIKDYSNAGFLTNKYLVSELQYIIVNHIDYSDMQYGDWVRKNKSIVQ